MYELIQVTPSKVAENWFSLSEGFASYLQPLVAGQESIRQTAMLELAVRDMAYVWIVSDKDKPIFHVYTILELDPVTRSCNLLIYAMFPVKILTVPIWKDLMAALSKFAKGLGCIAVTLFTKDSRVIDLMNSVGGSVDERYIYREVFI